MNNFKKICPALFLALALTACGQTNDTTAAASFTSTSSSADAGSSFAGADAASSASLDGTSESAASNLSASDTSHIASSNDKAASVDLSSESLTPVTASEIADGTYDIDVESSSSMFKIESCSLTVADGEMTAVMTMSGSGYAYVYMGTDTEAAAADSSALISSKDNADGKNTFTVPVAALDQELDCAAFSKKKQQWYARTLIFTSSSLPTDARTQDVTTIEDLALSDGTYTADASLEGGSGKTTITSPLTFTVKDGKATMTVEFSSPYYDYMMIDSVKYEPVNTDGNSAFEIPLTGFDYAMPVIADTTAMSTPHEIDYTICVDSSSITKN